MQSVFSACASGSYICIYHRHHCRTIRLYICFSVLKNPPPNENSTNCEVRAVIRLLSTKEFFVVSRNVFYEIVTARLKFRKLRSCWVPKILSEAYKTKYLARHSVFFNDIAKCIFFIVHWNRSSNPWLTTFINSWGRGFKQFVLRKSEKLFCDRKVLLVDLHRLTHSMHQYTARLYKNCIVQFETKEAQDNNNPHSTSETEDLITSYDWFCIWLDSTLTMVTKSNRPTFFEDGIKKLITRYDEYN